ncbi:ISL3 family transposase [Candidatus Neomicrothrix sp.]|uniref:ISL3 family transposase n=1 Tax=Candidatus Neomicrothrix sp. TaxID=2719034 RepID=UPI00259521B9|nr:ISL3 family transposase [Candidatus Microthrix sp.]HMS46756.1 ISL3 family transposase [Candidatus Microthrix sp.]
MKNLWHRVLGFENSGRRVVIESVDFDPEAEEIVATVRQRRNTRRRCGVCGRHSAGYDRGRSTGPRRWRSLDMGTVQVFIEAEASRVRCRTHGVVASEVPWARHGSRFTRGFEDTIGWLATATSKTAVTELMRVGWRTVGGIVERIQVEIDGQVDRLAGLRRIGIDEISYKRGHKYLTIVVDHDSGRLLWAAVGRDEATVTRFFELLGEERCAEITHVSADSARWITNADTAKCPQAVQCADPFHVVAWATDALDELRRDTWNDARKLARKEPKRKRGRPPADAPPRPGNDLVKGLKGARYALLKNPENLTDNQRAKLAWVAKTDPRLHRGYLLKEALRFCFKVKGQAGKDALDRWLSWAQRCRIDAFVKLGQKIRRHRAAINATLDHGLSNALIESTNTKIRVLTRMAYGFKTPEALIALALLSLGGYRPDLPGRTPTK